MPPAPFSFTCSHKGFTRNSFRRRVTGKIENGECDPVSLVDGDTANNYRSSTDPCGSQDQRNSWHGVDYPLPRATSIRQYYAATRRHSSAVDDGVGRVIEASPGPRPVRGNTLVIYMGDNGFAFGEHGLIDKRTAYEESMRVPMLLHAPRLVKPGHGSTTSSAISRMSPLRSSTVGVRSEHCKLDGAGLVLSGARLKTRPGRDEPSLRMISGTQFPPTPTRPCLARRPLQVHPLSRRLGPERVLR